LRYSSIISEGVNEIEELKLLPELWEDEVMLEDEEMEVSEVSEVSASSSVGVGK